MIKKYFNIGETPAVLFGKESDKAFIVIHGQGGNKEEAERFAKVAECYGYRTLAVDLPKHGGRKDAADFVPWEVVPELRAVVKFAKEKYETLSLYATSIGVYFSLLAFRGESFEKCLLVSPLLDMVTTIDSLMGAAGVSEERLKAESEIKTDFGQTLSYKYLCYARAHKVSKVSDDTSILYASGDEVVPRFTVEKFAEENGCDLRILSGCEHWLHTAEEIAALETWEREKLEK